MRLVWVDTGWACFGFDIDAAGSVRNAAPIAAWMEGKHGDAMIAYWKKRGANVKVLS